MTGWSVYLELGVAKELDLKLGFLPREGFEHWQPEHICRELSAIGYKGVEWSRHHFRPREMSPAALKRLVDVPSSFEME